MYIPLLGNAVNPCEKRKYLATPVIRVHVLCKFVRLRRSVNF